MRPAPLDLEGLSLTPGERSENVRRLQRALKQYGYGIEETGSYGEETRSVIRPFSAISAKSAWTGSRMPQHCSHCGP